MTRSAIKLLNIMGYPKAVVKRAEERAQNFVELSSVLLRGFLEAVIHRILRRRRDRT